MNEAATIPTLKEMRFAGVMDIATTTITLNEMRPTSVIERLPLHLKVRVH